MVAVAPTPPTRNIRVYCPTHKVGFSASASSVVQCGSQKHTLSTDFRTEGFWEYCCDCQHYWPLDAAKGNIATDECPVCERSLAGPFFVKNVMLSASNQTRLAGARSSQSQRSTFQLRRAPVACISHRQECAALMR